LPAPSTSRADRGTWKLDSGTLVSPVSAAALIKLPASIPPQYDLAFTIERKANQKAIVIGFVRGGQQSTFLLDSEGTMSGLDLYSNDTHHGAVLTNGQASNVILKVRKVGVQVLVDGKVIFERRSIDPLPPVSAEWKPATMANTSSALSNRYVISKLTLTPIERKPWAGRTGGQGRGAPKPGTSGGPSPAPAIQLLTAALLCALMLCVVSPCHAGGGPENLFLVVNSRSQNSLTVANYYGRLRRIPPGNICYLDWDGNVEATDIDTFRQKILGPALQAISERALSNQIDYLIYSSDFPRRIDFAADLPAA
jgi:hypothetical protein